MRKSTYIDTAYPGIKKRIKDGKYIVTLDCGRSLRMNKNTGVMEMRQTKTTKIVDTLTEAKALQGKNKLFHKLNELGNTIIMITPDLTVAENADRILRIVDGCI